MGDARRHRASLSLRAERAFGLRAVRVDLLKRDESELTAVAEGPAPVDADAVRQATRATAANAPALFPQAIAKPTATLNRKAIALPFDAPVLATAQKTHKLETLNATQVRGCTKCVLCETRTQTVFGEGDVDAQLFFIGEGPGENEDLTGRPFVGKAGQLLNKMIAAMGLKREQVFIANIVKCRPPDNRAPAPEETEACTPYLVEQLETIRPRAIVTLGLPAARFMLDSKETMGKLRGHWHSWRGIKLMPTFHPSYVLRSYTPETRAAVWSDLQQVMSELGLAKRASEAGNV